MAGVAVGIDLGTTNSVVALSQGGRPRVLTAADGSALIPSVVSFHPNGQTLVGASAKQRRPVDPANTIFSVKRLMGRPFESEEVRRARNRFGFELREGPDAAVLVHTRTGDLSLPEISALILREIRRIGETSLGGAIDRAVVTVPANFNELQRSATKLAGQIADLEVVRILNEPTAAALAYGYGRGARERIAVYDFGGGTFDVTLLELSGNVFEVLATAGDTFLGGDDIDLLLTESLADALLQAHRVDARQDRRAYELLRAAAEQAKIDLSSTDVATVRIPEVGYGPGGRALEFRTRITRAELEALAAPLVGRTFDVCAEAFKLANMRATECQTVILVGGSSRMPAVRSRVAEFFGREPLTTLPPEQVVGMGAAILAEALTAGSRKRAPTGEATVATAGRTRTQTLRPVVPGASTGVTASNATPGRSQPPPPLQPRPPGVGPTNPLRAPTGSGLHTLTASLEALTPGDGVPRRVNTNPGVAASVITAVTESAGVVRPATPLIHTGTPLARPSDSSWNVPRSTQRPIDQLDEPEFDVAPARTRLSFDDDEQTATRIPVPTPATPAARPPVDPIASSGMREPAPEAASASRLRAEGVVPVRPAQVLGGDEPRPAPPLPPPTPAAAFERTEISSARTMQPAGVRTALMHAAVDPPPAPVPAAPTAKLTESMLGFRAVRPEPAAALPASPSPLSGLSFPPPPAEPSATLTGQSIRPMSNPPLPLLLDVTPHTLGIETVAGMCEAVIARNATIPVEQTREFATAYDNQAAVRIRISQGESRRFGENQALGELELTGLRPAPRGDVKISVTFELDADGTLRVHAKEPSTGLQTQTRVVLLTMPTAAAAAGMAERQRGQA